MDSLEKLEVYKNEYLPYFIEEKTKELIHIRSILGSWKSHGLMFQGLQKEGPISFDKYLELRERWTAAKGVDLYKFQEDNVKMNLARFETSLHII